MDVATAGFHESGWKSLEMVIRNDNGDRTHNNKSLKQCHYISIQKFIFK